METTQEHRCHTCKQNDRVRATWPSCHWHSGQMRQLPFTPEEQVPRTALCFWKTLNP